MEQAENNKPRDTHLADLVDHYWGSINHVTALIRASEIKAGLILSFYGILLNLVYQTAHLWMDPARYDLIGYILIGLWFCTVIISIYFSMRCFMPKIEGNYSDNIFFFGDVISKFGTIKDFSETFYRISLDEEKVFQQMGEQIFITSKIADWKFVNVKKAFRFLAIGLVLLFAAVIYYIIYNSHDLI